MTLAFIFAAFALILDGGWALTRASGRPTAVSPPRGGDQVLMDQSLVGALLLDPALRVAWANDTFCDLFGLTRSELIGRRFADVVQKELTDLVEEPDVVESSLLEAYASTGEASPFNFSLRAQDGRDHRDKDGTVLPVEMISTPLRSADGAVTGVVDAITAVGDLQKLQSEQAGGAGETS
jgi:PAS domain S-box-containing protein